jgi:pyruvate kinase
MTSCRNTKIVATVGPATSKPETLKGLIQAGMNVARLNFSHGTHDQHRNSLYMIRQASRELDQPVAALLDLSGPKLRIGEIADGAVPLEEGSEVRLSVSAQRGTSQVLPIPACPWLPGEVKPGQRILLDDGAIRLMIKTTSSDEVVCTVVTGGMISSHKGINLPDTVFQELEIPTEKDRQDLAFGIQEGVDFVAQSFIRTAQDVRNLRRLITEAGSKVRLIAKIEKGEALANIHDIVAESDGVMVARGDLGVETELEMVVLKQKEIIKLCNRLGKVVITATQMLQSMIANPAPTRAEVSDVTNAILDGTDAVMLSGETAVGKYPVAAVSVMANIAIKTEEVFDSDRFLYRREPSRHGATGALAHAACLLARDLPATVIACVTGSGQTALLVSGHRPRPPIVALCREEIVANQMALVWGIHPVLVTGLVDPQDVTPKIRELVLRLGLAQTGDRFIIVSGIPVWGPANFVGVAAV